MQNQYQTNPYETTPYEGMNSYNAFGHVQTPYDANQQQVQEPLLDNQRATCSCTICVMIILHF